MPSKIPSVAIFILAKPFKICTALITYMYVHVHVTDSLCSAFQLVMPLAKMEERLSYLLHTESMHNLLLGCNKIAEDS